MSAPLTAEMEGVARRIAAVMFEARPEWRRMILEQMRRGITYGEWRSSFDETLGRTQMMRSMYARWEARGIDADALLRVMYDESRRLAAGGEA